jgi:two-component system, NarL family, nitrate/nitrite response regulator NarL
MDEIIRIVIADDHPIFRDGLRRLLEAEPGLQVIGEASDGQQAVQLAHSLKPDVLLLDLAMPRYPGLEALRELSRGNGHHVRTLLLTASIEKQQIAEALQIGARGVVMKEAATQVLFTALRAVMRGQYWVGHEAVTDLPQHLRSQLKADPRGAKPRPYGLTNRELEIVGSIVDGNTNKEIAQKFSLSEDTVKHHLTSIFDKLGVANRLELALFAINNRLIG